MHERGRSSSLFCDVDSDKNAFFLVIKVLKAQSITFNDFDEVVGSF
ncbi:hypothetical protein SGADD02_00288 [Streptococcus gallolyticus]|uniref:Uncharacterized protein n=1 Tax=Streptococcus gallolyticus TaxID=315405 RepID=A0A139NBX2_9STRE|nr:hypothetical protein SGADD02_00288 [Streptococcus gallolyticus]